MKQCPCGSNLSYSLCCDSYINGQDTPKTPEALMRSRYTAYTLADIDYIKKTMRGKSAIGFNEEEAKQWAQSVYWLELNLIKTIPHATDASIGYVEFAAKYLDKNVIRIIHEISEFHHIDDIWFYTDGKQIEHPTQLIGRNTVCPCGSKRKFKNCHE
jgi:SEC-C motif-containing protein